MDWLIALLTWISSDPAVLDRESPRAAAAAEVAYASLERREKAEEKKSAVGGDCPTGTCPLPRKTNAPPQR